MGAFQLMNAAPGTTIGAYRIEELIGRGGMGAVYRAYHPSLGRHVAVKVLPAYLREDEEFRERLRQEGQAIAGLRHPNILQIFDSGEDQGLLYLVTEYVRGGTLAEKMGTPQSLERTLEMVRPVADALDYAHARGILHRDVKPSNILLTADGMPVLADFGLARMSGAERLTRTGVGVGTPEYMAPEQGAGEDAGAAADRYALAVVAYELLTGRVPFKAETPLAVLLAHMHRPVPPPRDIHAGVAAGVSEVLIQGLAKAPEDRFPTAAAFVAALDAAGNPTYAASSPSNQAVDTAAPQAARAAVATAVPTSASGAAPTQGRVLLSRRSAIAGLVIVGGGGGGLLGIAKYTGAFGHAGDTPAPSTANRWTMVSGPPDGIGGQAAALVRGGLVLLAGGYTSNGGIAKGASLYDPALKRWARTGAMHAPRYGYPLLTLADGRALIVGGANGNNSTGACEVFDPARRVWTTVGSLRMPRYGHTTTLLPGGEVLVVGGNDGTLKTAEIWNPRSGQWTTMPGPPHTQHTATVLRNGQVLVADGGRVDLFNPKTRIWSQEAPMPATRWNHTASLLADGRVLMAGGNDYNGDKKITLATAAIYDPRARSPWQPTGPMHGRRAFAAAAPLPGGQVLVAGGELLETTQPLVAVEIYDPTGSRWLAAMPLPAPRYNATALALRDGRVLLAGGNDQHGNVVGVLAIY
jgi:Protein kinase domain/Galactose oxidase, central domain